MTSIFIQGCRGKKKPDFLCTFFRKDSSTRWKLEILLKELSGRCHILFISFLQNYSLDVMSIGWISLNKMPEHNKAQSETFICNRFNDSANKISSNKCDFNSVKLNSWAVPSYQVARNMTLARDQRLMCCTRFEHDSAWATWSCVLETVRGAVRRL